MKYMNRLIVAVFLLAFLTASYVNIIIPAKASEDSWITKAPLPLTRTGLGVAPVNGKIYAFGGHPPGGVTTNINEEYDPKTDKWVSRRSLPNSLAWFGFTVYQDEIYVIGGVWGIFSGMATNSLLIYNPETDLWKNGASMPTTRGGIQANIVDGRIYAIGGVSNDDETVNLNEVYDPDTDTWATKTPIPTPVSSYASAVVDGKIYVIGGLAPVVNSSAKSRVNLNQIYDPETDTWSQGTPIPENVNANAGATTGIMASKRIYVIGDGLNQVYDPATNRWTAVTPMPNASNRMTNFGDVEVAVLNDQLYAIGGVYREEDQSTYSVNMQYTPIGYGTPDPSYVTPTDSDVPEVIDNVFPTTLVIATLASAAVVSGLIFAFFRKHRR